MHATWVEREELLTRMFKTGTLGGTLIIRNPEEALLLTPAQRNKSACNIRNENVL
jgi:hypothetical protein